MKNTVLSAFFIGFLLISSCASQEQGGLAQNQKKESSGGGDAVHEPALSLTEAQKASGPGYWSLRVTGPVHNENYQFVCSEGSRALYADSANTTRVLARDANNPKTVLMVDFNSRTGGEFMMNRKLGDTVVLVVSVANADGSIKLAGSMEEADDGYLRVPMYIKQGYIEGLFAGTMKIDKQQHAVTGNFRVRLFK